MTVSLHKEPSIEMIIEEKVLIRITPSKIWFNREAYPISNAQDFAQAFIDILEKNYDVTFTKRERKWK